MPRQLSLNKLNPGSFTLPCSINIFNFYAIVDLGVNVNIMLESMLKKLNLTRIKKTNVLVEMADMTKRILLGIVENILVKIDKFCFPSDFEVINMEATRNETIIFGSPFLATIHTDIDIFPRKITPGTEHERVKISTDNVDYDFTLVNEKVYMLKVLPNNNLSDELATHEFNYLLHIDSDIFSYDINMKETTNTVQQNVHWCELIRQERSDGHKLWASYDPYHNTCSGGNCLKRKKCFWSSMKDDKHLNLEWERLSCDNWIRIKYGNVDNTADERLFRNFWSNKLEDRMGPFKKLEDQEGPKRGGEAKSHSIIKTIVNKLTHEWFKGLREDKGDLEGIIDYF
ncbi:reverse transcriptase domain-containing protein [Tanacetum coccineum]